MKVRIIVLFTVATLATSCKKKEAAPPPPAPAIKEPGPAATPAPPPAAGGIDDAQIAMIVVTANQVDIDAGQLAIKKTQNAEVKKFAERMVTDHSAVNKAAGELVSKLGVTPVESDASKGLASGGSAKRAELEKLDGDAFDKAYVDNEVAYHEAVIGVLDKQLIPGATNKELKDALTGARPAFDAHLQHAKQIQAALAGGGAASHQHK